jgi:hypothetical protein
MKNRNREIRAVLGALFAASALTALQLLSIGLALGEIGGLPEVTERRATPAPARAPAPAPAEPVVLLVSRCNSDGLDARVHWPMGE